jgi:hypothetical protein
MDHVIAPFALPGDVFKDEIEGKWKRDRDPERCDPQTMCVAHHWMVLGAKGGDALAREFLRQREEMERLPWCLAFSNFAFWKGAFTAFIHVHFMKRLLHSDGVGGQQTTNFNGYHLFRLRAYEELDSRFEHWLFCDLGFEDMLFFRIYLSTQYHDNL